MEDKTKLTADIIIIGGGLAGASTALVLGRQGVRVLLIDQHSVYPDVFKAEKIEADQADSLRRLKMFEVLAPGATAIHAILSARDRSLFGALEVEQYGMYYADMVNAVRRNIPSTVQFRLARVDDVATSTDVQKVTLDSGEVLTSRLVVLACGTVGRLASQLGLHREVIAKDFSISFGFNVARRDGRPFDFDAFTYFPSNSSMRIGFFTLFPIKDVMRANLFMFRSVNDEWVRTFLRDPRLELERLFPKLTASIREYDVVGKVETGPVTLYKAKGHLQPGLVLIGDSFQSVCPTTGTGLSKVLTDVETLCHDCVPGWLATPEMGLEKIAKFYDHPHKRAVDAHSLSSALYLQRASTSPFFTKWGIKGEIDYWKRRLLEWPVYHRLGKRLTA